MLKSQLEQSSQNYEATSVFVENIFDTVKKAKAAKAAKSLAESKLMTPYQYSFADLSPGKKKKPRKNAKKNGKMKKSPAPKKKMNLRKPKTREGAEKRKKTTPTKSPRKYTKRITKVPAPTDIDDEEAAFILSSISQRSFDSFYNRLNSCETNTIHIPLDLPSLSVQNLSSSTPSNSSHHHDQAYYVMLDHNYWIEPKVITKTETVKSETFLNNSTIKSTVTQPEEQIASPNRSASESTQSVSETTRSVSESTQSVTESNRSVSESNDFSSQLESKVSEVNNNKLQASPVNEVFEQEPCMKEHNTAVKKRWLRQAATEMKTPPKKRKNLETLQINTKQETASLIVVNDKIAEVKIIEDIKKEEDEEVKIKVEESPPQDLILETKVEVPLKEEELKKEDPEEVLQEVLPETVEAPLIEAQTSQKDLSTDKLASSPEIMIADVVEEPATHQNSSDTEQDEMNWEKVMNFHRSQLNLLEEANKRFTEEKVGNDLMSSSGIKSVVEQKCINFTPVKSLYKRETSVHQQLGFDFNPATRSRFNLLDTPIMAETRRTSDIHGEKYSYHRSIGEFSPTNTRKSRWGSSTAVSFASNSFQPFTTYCSENNYSRSEPYTKTNFSNYRAQKELCTNGQNTEVEEPSWALYETQFNKLSKETFASCLRDSSFDSKKVLDCTLENIIPKKSFTAYDALTKTKTAVADPRLNPSLLQDKKDEALTPKKKVNTQSALSTHYSYFIHLFVLLFSALFRSVSKASVTDEYN